MTYSWGKVAWLLVMAVAVGCYGRDGDGCRSDRPCVDRLDCSEGERCNTALPEPVCQPILCGSFGSVCSEDAICEEGLVCAAEMCADQTLCDEAVHRLEVKFEACGIRVTGEEPRDIECTEAVGAQFQCVADCTDAASCDAINGYDTDATPDYAVCIRRC